MITIRPKPMFYVKRDQHMADLLSMLEAASKCAGMWSRTGLIEESRLLALVILRGGGR